MKSIALNTKTTIWRKAAKFAGILMLIFSVFALNSCSRDDDPSDNDFFAGTYRGTLTYDGIGGPSPDITASNGSVFVTKIGSATKYNFRFSNGIPDINGIEFRKEGDNTMVMVGSTTTSYIRITNNNLTILYSTNGQTWTADATR